MNYKVRIQKNKDFQIDEKQKDVNLTEEGYKIKNMLRLTIGSKNDCLKFMLAVERIFKT